MNNYELVKGLDRSEHILKNGKALNIYGAKKILEAQQQEIAELKAIVNEFIEEFSCFVAQHECNCGHPSCRTCKECRDAFKLLDKTPAQCLQSVKSDVIKTIISDINIGYANCELNCDDILDYLNGEETKLREGKS